MPQHRTLGAASATQQLLKEEHGGLNLAELALVQDSIPSAYDAGVGVIKHYPLACRVNKGMVVRAIVAHHAAQSVQARLLRLVDVRQVYFLRIKGLCLFSYYNNDAASEYLQKQSSVSRFLYALMDTPRSTPS